jgi:uncharacterized membrane protein
MLGAILRSVKGGPAAETSDSAPCAGTLRAVLPNRTQLALAVVAAAHAGTTFSLALLRFEQVHQRTFDLALYARAAWGLAHGDLWVPVIDVHVLGAHVAPVLVLLGLIGRAFGTVPVLLAAQSLAVAACVWPLARIGARRMGTLGVFVAVSAWLLYPNLGHVTTYEFHPGTLALLPMCWAFDALDRGRLAQLAWASAGVMACRDDFGLACVLFALLYALQHRDRRANWLALLALSYTLAAVGLTVLFAPQKSSMSLHFGVWGGSPLGVFRVLVEDPARAWAHFGNPARLAYLPRLLAPLCFFGLFAPRLLVPALPYLALNLISEFPTALEQYSHYLSPAVPPIVVASVVGFGKLAQSMSRFTRAVLALVWTFALGIAYEQLGGLPLSRDFDHRAFRPDAATDAAREVLRFIPREIGVQAPDALLPHLAERKVVRRGPPPEAGTPFVVLDVSHRQRFAQREDLLRTSEEPRTRSWLARADHGLLVYAPPYALLARGQNARSARGVARYFLGSAPPEPAGTQLSACLSVQKAKLEAHTLELTLVAHGPCASDLAVRLGANDAPTRVDLLFDGALSPALLQAGDVLRSRHLLDDALARELQQHGAWVGVLRSSGARPDPSDPVAVRVLPPGP